MIRDILLLGNPGLYKVSEVVLPEEIPGLSGAISDLHDTLLNYRERYGAGRAIAAPQIGIYKRLIYLFIDKPTVFINPVLTFPSDDSIEVLDDCMSFPNLLVKVKRFKKCRVCYTDQWGNPQLLELEDDLSELIQHEYDHLNGVLATMRAVDHFSFWEKRQVLGGRLTEE